MNTEFFICFNTNFKHLCKQYVLNNMCKEIDKQINKIVL